MTNAAGTRIDRRTRRARSEGRDGRQALLEAAARVVAERGLRAASVDDVAREAGFSKGALYWHFQGKDDLFMALLEERVDGPLREMIELLESAPSERDMAPEASRLFVEFFSRGAELLLLDQEYWSQAVRDPDLRARYAKRQAEVRAALGKALETRMGHLGAPPFDIPAEDMATVFMSLASGLARERLIAPEAVPDDLLGQTGAVIYAGLVARARR